MKPRLVVYCTKADDGYDRAWRVRQDGIKQRYRQKRYVIYQQPKLSRSALTERPEIPNDTLLRGASAQEVVGAVRKWFYEQPAHQSLKRPRAIYFPATEAEYRDRLTANVKVLAEGLPRATEAYAVSNPERRVVCLSPDTTADLNARDLARRLTGAATLIHELCHIALPYRAVNEPLEEGSVMLYADALAQRAFGIQADVIEQLPRSYDEWVEAFACILSTLGTSPAAMFAHLQRFRTTADGARWLQDALLDDGQRPDIVSDLFAPSAGDVLRSHYRNLALNGLEGGDLHARAYP